MVQLLCDFWLVVGFPLLGELGGGEVAVGGVGPVDVVVDEESSGGVKFRNLDVVEVIDI